MADTTDFSQYTFVTPAQFRLRFLGYLDVSWSEELGGADIEHLCLGADCAVTVVTVYFVDQAELIGMLNRLYGLGFPLLSVECLHVG